MNAAEQYANEPWRDDDYYDDDAHDCTLCGGEGYVECVDPIQCLEGHAWGALCPCIGCRGSGLAKDQTVW